MTESEKCVNCLVYNWPTEDVPVFRCSNCKFLSYCTPECQKEHWKKVHSKQCKILAGQEEVSVSTHLPKSCPGCKEEQELGPESINSPDCPAWGCLVGPAVNGINVIIEGKFLSAVESGDMTRKFNSRVEHTLFVMQQIVNKLMRTNSSRLECRAELSQLFELVTKTRMGIIFECHMYPAKLMEVDFNCVHSYILDSEFKDAVFSSIISVSSKLGTSAGDPCLASETLKLLACFLFDQFHHLKDYERLSVEDDLPRDVRELVCKLGTSTKFEETWDSVLEALKAGLVHHNILLDILCGGNRDQECNHCQRSVVIKRVFAPFVDEPNPETEKPSIVFRGLVFSCTAMACQEASMRKAQVFHNQVMVVMNLKVSTLGEENTCDNCFMLGRRMHRCSQCKTKAYCSEECQLEDWKIHEKICNEGEVTRKVKGGTSVRVDAVKKEVDKLTAEMEISSRIDPDNQIYLDIANKIQ